MLCTSPTTLVRRCDTLSLRCSGCTGRGGGSFTQCAACIGPFHASLPPLLSRVKAGWRRHWTAPSARRGGTAWLHHVKRSTAKTHPPKQVTQPLCPGFKPDSNMWNKKSFPPLNIQIADRRDNASHGSCKFCKTFSNSVLLHSIELK